METDAAKSQTHNAAGATQSMMAEAAEHDASQDPNSEFYNTGRVGRRNALPDILNHHHVTTSTADLPEKLSALSTKGTIIITTLRTEIEIDPSTDIEDSVLRLQTSI